VPPEFDLRPKDEYHKAEIDTLKAFRTAFEDVAWLYKSGKKDIRYSRSGWTVGAARRGGRRGSQRAMRSPLLQLQPRRRSTWPAFYEATFSKGCVFRPNSTSRRPAEAKEPTELEVLTVGMLDEIMEGFTGNTRIHDAAIKTEIKTDRKRVKHLDSILR